MDTNVTAEVEAPKMMAAPGGAAKRVARALVLSPVDQEVLATLAVARYLSHGQLRELGFWNSESTQNHRMATFAGLSSRSAEGRVYVEKLETHDSRGAKTVIWGLTELGYRLAADIVAVPPRQVVGPELLEHEVQLNEVLVSLLRAGVPPRPADGRAPRIALGLPLQGTPFKWLSSGGSRLPWQQYDREEAKTKERVIKPDAVLEIPGRRQRVFLELERGTHTIVPADPGAKEGATINKVVRYQRFCALFADPTKRVTFYQQLYPDGFAARLVFVVSSEARRDHVRAAIAAMPKAPGVVLLVEVYTRREAACLLVDQVYGAGTSARLFPAEGSSPPAPLCSMSEVRELAAITLAFYATIQGERHRVRAENQRSGGRVPELAYPPNTTRAIELLRKLGVWRER